MLSGVFALVYDANLRAVDRLQPGRLRGLRELHRAAEIVVVGQRQRAVALSYRGVNELIGARGAVKEGKGRMTVEFCVQHERMFASLRSLCGNSFPASCRPRRYPRKQSLRARQFWSIPRTRASSRVAFSALRW